MKKICMFDVTGKYIKTFDSIIEAKELCLDKLRSEQYKEGIEKPYIVAKHRIYIARNLFREVSTAHGYIFTFEDDETQYLIGFDAYEIVENGGDFKEQFVVNNGTFTVSDDMFATGTVVTVYDSTGAEYAQYVIIFFGDINGDGAVDVSDIADASDAYNFSIELTGANYYASDIFADDEYSISLDVSDIALLSDLYNYATEWTINMQTHVPA